MSTLKDEIKNKTFKSVYLLYGDDVFLRNSAVKSLLSALTGGDTMNYMTHTGAEPILGDFRDFTDTMPFFAERRVAFLEDTGLFKSASEGFDTWLETLPETSVVVFSETEIDKRNKLYKIALKAGTVEEFMHPTEEVLGKWILRKIGASGKNITKSAYELFLSSMKMDYAFADNETEKLISYALNEESITEEMVRAICTPSIEDHIFNLVEAVADGKRDLVLKYYYELLALREAPLKILALAGKEFERLSVTKKMVGRCAGDADIVSALALNPRILWKYKKNCLRFSAKSLNDAVKDAVETEKAIKSGKLSDRMGTELYLMKMTDR